MLETPVIYIFFNRPGLTRVSFSIIREQRPQRLYLVSDGPRPGHPTDAVRCAEARAIVEELLDWKCEVFRDYSEENLGCRRRISSGLTAAFSQLGEAIVLEDDILPHVDFFPFCAKFLAHYRDSQEVHSICGFNPIGKYLPGERRPVPSRVNSMWGWASWQRAWKSYRANLEGWTDPETRESLRSFLQNDLYFNDMAHGFDKTLNGIVSSWAYPWIYTLFVERRISLTSPVNLIVNAGFSSEATHTNHGVPAYIRGLGTYPLAAGMAIPESLAPDILYDRVAPLISQTSSIAKIALMRLLCRHSRPLAQFSLS